MYLSNILQLEPEQLGACGINWPAHSLQELATANDWVDTLLPWNCRRQVHALVACEGLASSDHHRGPEFRWGPCSRLSSILELCSTILVRDGYTLYFQKCLRGQAVVRALCTQAKMPFVAKERCRWLQSTRTFDAVYGGGFLRGKISAAARLICLGIWHALQSSQG